MMVVRRDPSIDGVAAPKATRLNAGVLIQSGACSSSSTSALTSLSPLNAVSSLMFVIRLGVSLTQAAAAMLTA